MSTTTAPRATAADSSVGYVRSTASRWKATGAAVETEVMERSAARMRELPGMCYRSRRRSASTTLLGAHATDHDEHFYTEWRSAEPAVPRAARLTWFRSYTRRNPSRVRSGSWCSRVRD